MKSGDLVHMLKKTRMKFFVILRKIQQYGFKHTWKVAMESLGYCAHPIIALDHYRFLLIGDMADFLILRKILRTKFNNDG